MACPSCGSWAVKADRSLAGRMVCGRCGQPLGGAVRPLRPRRRRLALPRPRGWWWALALLALGAVLAAVPPGPPPGQGPVPADKTGVI
ncbi:MAG: hypothetical protein VKN13_03670 [Cyanobacteriota bacterium]|nr:hypothetical protein [Cyanobacteriota bacterium]